MYINCKFLNYLLSGSSPQIIVAAFKIQLKCNDTVALKNPTIKIEHISDSSQSSDGKNTVTINNNGASNQ